MATTQRTRRKPRRVRRNSSPASAVRLHDDAIRWSKVIAAQSRIVSGHYDRADVRDVLVAAVLRELRRA